MERDFGGSRSQAGPPLFFPSDVRAIQLLEDLSGPVAGLHPAARAIIPLRMRNIKLTISYDGTNFHGWQIQPGLPTIQGLLNDAACTITQEKIVVHGASRTDSGVHALGQVAHFKTLSGLPASEFQRALNALLPPAIRIVDAEEVGPEFHARWLAQAKTYRYRIYRGQVLPPFDYGRALHYPWPLDEDAMATAARQFAGEHDFTSFAASSGSEEDDGGRNMVRVIHSSELSGQAANEEIEYHGSRAIVFEIHGAEDRGDAP